MKKQLLAFLLSFISMLSFGQNLNDKIFVSTSSYSNYSGPLGQYSECTLSIFNNSDCNIKVFNVYASQTDTGEIFYSDTQPNKNIDNHQITSITIRYEGGNYLTMGGWLINVVYINLNDGYVYQKTARKPANSYGTNITLADASTETDVSNLNNDISIYLSSMKSGYINGVLREEAELVIHNNSNNELKANNIFAYNTSKSDIFFSNISPDFNIRAGESAQCKIFYTGDNYLMMGGWYFTMIYSNVTDGNVYLKTVLKRENVYSSVTPLEDVVSNNSLQPYAALSDNNTILTFYYDTKKLARKGMSVGPIAYDEVHYKPLSEWNDYSSSIKTVVFDDSFADCHDITSTAYWFESFRNLEEIRGLSNLNTENVTDMKRMFIWCSNLTTLDLGNFNTTNVTDMSHMFQQCSSLKNLNIGAFDTKNVVNMHQMFDGCSSITTLDLSHFDTGNVTDMGFMFYRCNNLETLDLSNFNTENVTDMSVFHDCIKLKTIYVNHDWNTKKVSETAFVFYNCYSLEGGQGTKWRDGEIWPIYARIDRGPSAPGYFTKKASQLINGHEYIDLGLPSGKLWAKTNYGASSESDNGIYMDWTSRHLIQLVWGNEWSTPSQKDFLELYNQCTFTWEYNANSIYGCKVTGPNGNSIFLPAAGFKIYGTPQMVGSDIYYWSDTEYESGFAYALQGSAENGISVYQTWNIELAMFPIRPVANGNGSSGEEEETYDYVDLALPSGLLWATTNVGANRPEEIGSYYAWGETSSKSEYSWATYKYANGSETTLTKYCNDSAYGNVDYKEVLEEQDDAATANWGKPWRTPTLSETQELINYCTWTLTTQNGVNGYKVTGANGNSIFLPASGVMQYSWSYYTERSVVMSANLFTYCTSASVLNCQDGAPRWWYGWSRCWGYPVRPVTSTDPSGITIPSVNGSQEIIGIYDLQGHKMDALSKGINIIKYKNGISKKVVR